MPYLLLLLLAFSNLTTAANTPELLLANSYHQDITITDYWVSEKYDGMRAYWNGHKLISRNGYTIDAPTWFFEHFPTQPLDGELWLSRGGFEALSSIVRTSDNTNTAWQQVRFMVFDAPTHKGTFDERLSYLHMLLDNSPSPYIHLVKQWRVTSHQQLQQQLDDIVEAGAEGLMLHKGSSLYQGLRSDDLLKLKPFSDAEAVVVRHFKGKGKYKDMMGSIEVVNSQQQHFRIGTGFSDKERQNPPPIGSTITYRFNGYTAKGLPRFARYLRLRNDW
jgi:DNA ligase-1